MLYEVITQAVRAFLLSNPDIADELESLNTAVPAPELHSAVCISNLQRSFSDVAQISAHHFEEFCRITSYNVCYTKLLRVSVDDHCFSVYTNTSGLPMSLRRASLPR